MQCIAVPSRQKILVPEDSALCNGEASAFAGMLGQAPTVRWKGRPYHVLPHTAPFVMALRGLGFKAPGLIETQYEWPGNEPPFRAQRVTADMLTLNKRAYVLSDIGVGKTRAALFAADFLMRQGIVRKALISAPLSTLSTVWEQEIMRVFTHRESVSLHGTKAVRLKRLALDVDFYIINHDGVKVLADELCARDDIDLVIIDELAVLRNARTKLWKKVKAVIRDRKYVWGMTGSPMPNGPLDIYGQAKLLTPQRVPFTATGWRASTMRQVSQFVWVPRRDAIERAYEALKPAVRFSRDECLDLPPRMVSTLTVQLSQRQKDVYAELVKRARVMLTEGEVTAANEGVVVNKLLQVSCGFVYTKTKGVANLQNVDRLATLRQIIEAARNKVIVFAPYVFAVRHLHAEVAKYANAGLVYGDISKKDRDDIFRQFQSGEAMRVLVAQPACMAHGLTLTSSNVIVWYSPIQHPEIYEQANGRITRAGQANKQFIVHLSGTAAETRVYSRLLRRQKMQGLLLDMFSEGRDDE